MIKKLVKQNELYITQITVFPIWSITLFPVEKGKMSVAYILQNNDNQARFLFNVIISEAVKGQFRTLGKQFFLLLTPIIIQKYHYINIQDKLPGGEHLTENKRYSGNAPYSTQVMMCEERGGLVA